MYFHFNFEANVTNFFCDHFYVLLVWSTFSDSIYKIGLNIEHCETFATDTVGLCCRLPSFYVGLDQT